MDEIFLRRKRRAGTWLLAAALALSLILPICCTIAKIAGLRLILRSYFIILFLIFLLMVGAGLLLWKLPAPAGKGIGRMAALLLPVSFLNGLCCFPIDLNILTLASAGCGLIAALFLFLLFAKSTRLKWLFGALTAAATILTLMILPFAMMFSLLKGSAETVRRVESPEGSYVAEIISDDQGALGGSTVVEVYRPDRAADLILLRLEEAPRRVYSGNYGEAGTISVIWQDERTLLINGVPYPVE